MIELLKILLSLSLSGTLLILVLILCKPLYKNRLSRQWQYYIWLVVVARLLLPFTPETSLVGNLFREVDAAIAQISTGGLTDSPLSPDKQTGTPTVESPEPEKTLVQSLLETAAQNIWPVCVPVWLMVSAGLLIRKATIYQGFVKYINAGRMEVTDMRLWEQLGKLVEQEGVKQTVELYTNSLISSPLLIGFFHPCIMLPSAELPDSDLENTILHELTHYKRRDLFYKWLVQAAICFHWFNPFVYFMGREINRACELSCDEAVIRPLNTQGRRAYGDTLLNAAGTGGKYKDSLASVTLSEGTEFLKERLDAIMMFQKPSKRIVTITAILTMFFTVGASFTGAYAAITNPALSSANTADAQINAITAAQADEMALALTNKIWVWDWIAFFVPYMSENGVNQIVSTAESSEWARTLNYSTMTPMKPFTQTQVDDARKSSPEREFLTRSDIDAHALMIMQSNGQWSCVDFMFPYMTDNGINQVKTVYAQKHGVQPPTVCLEPK